MRRTRCRTKKAITLVELVVAMALTAIFAGACIALILPISKIYTYNTELARAQLVADNVAACLRSACTGNDVELPGDAWIASSGNVIIGDEDKDSIEKDSLPGSGSALVIRKSPEYCMTIASNYSINGELYNKVKANDTRDDETYIPETDSTGLTSRAIYRMFNGEPASNGVIASSDERIHFGYFSAGTNVNQFVFPDDYYDFTDPLPNTVYDKYTVEIEFSNMEYDIDTLAPAYVNCKITVKLEGNTAYTREIALRLS